MWKLRGLIGMVFALATLVGCAGGGRSAAVDMDTLYAPAYARGFELYTLGNSSVVRIKNPWQGAREVHYDVFVSRDGELPPAGFGGVCIPVRPARVVCMSSSHVAYLAELGQVGSIAGVSGSRFLYGDRIRARCADRRTVDVGYDNLVDYELLASLAPEVVFIYGVSGENSGASKRLAELGIPYMYVGDYLEASPLGKSEWLVAFGEIFGIRKEARRRFEGIEERYNAIKDRVAAADARPVAMLNAPWRDTWYVPGDGSYMVRLVDDAGGAYACAGDESERTRAISAEAAFVAARRADTWLCPNTAASVAEVVAMNPRFADIPAVSRGEVYNNTARTVPGSGGSDFWESGAVHADAVLADLAAIFHPELFPDHELYFFKRLPR